MAGRGRRLHGLVLGLIGQTPGMRIVGLRIVPLDQPRMDLRIAVHRLFGFILAVIPLGLGFLGIVFSDRRRGLEDTMGHTEVHYDLAERQAPWSEPRDAPPREVS